MPINHTYDVLIIGAGPVGLATALGLYQRGIDNILVLDQTHSFRQAGQTVDLLPNGLKALKCISNEAYEQITLTSYTFSKGYPPVFSQLIGFSNPEQLIIRPYYLHPADLPVEQDYIWTFERVALVGDAAHGMPPFMAQGTNQGFEDALFIVKLITKLIQNNELTNGEKVTNLLQKYERKRRPFMTKIQSATMNSYRWTKTEWDQYSQAVYSRNFSSQI